MNDYSSNVPPKWLGQTDGILKDMQARWESGRPHKTFLALGFPEPDSRLDQMTPALDKRILSYKGSVVMGHFARAYFPAYIPGERIHYGSVVYSTDSAPVDVLFELAWRVNELRKDDSRPPIGTEKVASAIRDDRSQFARILLPPSVSGVNRAYFANTCVFRSRLPLGYIHDRLVPLLVAPGESEWCTLLPLRFWNDQFKTVWSSGPPAYDPEAFEIRCVRAGIRP